MSRQDVYRTIIVVDCLAGCNVGGFSLEELAQGVRDGWMSMRQDTALCYEVEHDGELADLSADPEFFGVDGDTPPPDPLVQVKLAPVYRVVSKLGNHRWTRSRETIAEWLELLVLRKKKAAGVAWSPSFLKGAIRSRLARRILNEHPILKGEN